jgi:2-polyprenyl-6-methoxyphenol hydroxylase-like FAD-dependent oxidoreductase
MILKNKQIAIVGGGPAGLTLARLLQQEGLQVKLYERDINKDARVQGSPLDMHEGSGLAALQKAGLMEAFKKNFSPGADRKLITDERATILFSDHQTKQKEDFDNPYFRPEIDRGPLRRILLESLQKDTVIWDSHFVSMERQNDGWLLHFKDGTAAYADLVIAADGANSKVRPYLTKSKPFYSGITMLEGAVYNVKKSAPQIAALLKGGKIMAFGKEKCLLMGSKGQCDLGFYASMKVDEGWAADNGLDYSDKAQMLKWFKEEYAGWSSIWCELFGNADTPFIPRPIYCMPLDQTWQTIPNLTLIGDAAHAMPPFAGEGANMAMLDALELSECLTSDKFNTLQHAIASYEVNMRKRGAIAAQKSLDNGALMHSRDALSNMLSFFSKH